MTKPIKLVILALAGGLALLLVNVAAQDGAEPTLAVATNVDWGEHVVTGAGMSVYTYSLDEDGVSNCVDACTNNWPPVTVEAGADATASEGLDASLLGTIERADGTSQVTYAGMPLYTFRRDTEAGHTRGQALGGQFFLIAVDGSTISERVPEEATEIDDELMTALMSEGRLTFTSHCAVCHGQEGGGGIGPGLVGNSVVGDKSFVINRVLDGFIEHGMPPFASALNDRQVAAVTTYIRNSWGNEYGPVLEEEVAAER